MNSQVANKEAAKEPIPAPGIENMSVKGSENGQTKTNQNASK